MIEIKNLTKKYGDSIIFQDMNYTFPKKGFVCVLGASGCGKSTLLHMLAGFDLDYTGSIKVGGITLREQDNQGICGYRHEHIGFVFQEYNLLAGYTVLENILLASKHEPALLEEKSKAEQLLKTFGILDKSSQKIENLSGGQKQRVGIVRALLKQPSIILADEPTGALDRKNATEIMNLLKEIAKDKLVVVITHDKKVSEQADVVLTIKNHTLEDVSNPLVNDVVCDSRLTCNPMKNTRFSRRGWKNFIVHIKRYLGVSFAISIGIFCFILSLSFGNVVEQASSDFKEKNTAFNNGYIKVEKNSEDVMRLLKTDARIHNIYRQFILHQVSLEYEGVIEVMDEKYPMPMAMESMSYGIMPKKGKQHIALSPSLAKKFSSNIQKLVGRKIRMVYQNTTYELTISGIFNAAYDNFYVSSDIEVKLYEKQKSNAYSISYDVKKFEDIVPFSKMLSQKGMDSKNAQKEVEAFQNTFQTIQRLFLIISSLMLAIALFISATLLVKQQNARYKELGLLSALGNLRGKIRNMILFENLLVALMAVAFNVVWLLIAIGLRNYIGYALFLSPLQIIVSILLTFVVILVISYMASHKLLEMEPSEALKK